MSATTSRKRVASVSEYVASKPKDTRTSLDAVRRAILKALPGAEEGLSYQMPVYTLNGVAVLYLAGWKSHYSLYPASDALVEAFATELAPYERSKGTIRFPFSEPVPVRLIERTPCFFVEPGKGVFAMFSGHRDDGRLALWVPVAPGPQPLMIEEASQVYFYPPYVGTGGWVGILLDQVSDYALESHLREARRIVAVKRKPPRKPRAAQRDV